MAMSLRNIGASLLSRRTWEDTLRYAKNHSRILIAAILVFVSFGTILAITIASQIPKAHAAGGAGATLPYVEMVAHSATTNGTILGPDYQMGDLASEGVDRTVVQLTQGQSVQFTLPQQADSINLRYALPDSSSGGGLNAPLSIYVNGTKQNDLQLTSQYAWVYGQPDFSNCFGTWTESPGGTPHHMFDEVHAMLPQMNQGATVKIQVDSEDNAQWY